MKSTPNRKEALGKGIRSLLQNIDTDLSVTEKSLIKEADKTNVAKARIPLSQIEANPEQPRHDFDETALSELAASVKIHDIIQPITVTRTATGNTGSSPVKEDFVPLKLLGLKTFPFISGT